MRLSPKSSTYCMDSVNSSYQNSHTTTLVCGISSASLGVLELQRDKLLTGFCPTAHSYMLSEADALPHVDVN